MTTQPDRAPTIAEHVAALVAALPPDVRTRMAEEAARILRGLPEQRRTDPGQAATPPRE